MDFAFATEPSPGRPNEDYLLLSDGFAILLDGVTPLPDLDCGCVHGPRWLVRMLGGHLATALSSGETADLDLDLAGAIEAVRREHGDTCDLTNPNSPSSTVAIVRERAGHLDYLVLCDSTVVFEDASGIVAVNDDRTATLPAYDRDTVAGLRNRPGGFWVASTVPEAAAEAVTGTVPLAGMRRLLLCTDGVPGWSTTSASGGPTCSRWSRSRGHARRSTLCGQWRSAIRNGSRSAAAGSSGTTTRRSRCA